MPDKYISRRRGKGYVEKTDRAGNVHTFTEEEYKGSHGHRVTGPDGRTSYERPQGTFRSGKLRSLGTSQARQPPASSGPREIHKVMCTSCGKECTVPFAPVRGRPVFCKECFAKRNSPLRPRTW